MNNTDHLKPYQFTSEQDKAEATENGRKGGKKSGIARRNKKKMKDIIENILTHKLSDEEMRELSLDGVLEGMTAEEIEELDYKFLLGYKLFRLATSDKVASVKAFETIRDTIGENPKDVKLSDSLSNRIIIINDLPDDQCVQHYLDHKEDYISSEMWMDEK